MCMQHKLLQHICVRHRRSQRCPHPELEPCSASCNTSSLHGCSERLPLNKEDSLLQISRLVFGMSIFDATGQVASALPLTT